MPSVEDGVCSALLEERVKLTDGQASRDHAHSELHLSSAYVGGVAKDRWLITHRVSCKGVHSASKDVGSF